MRFQLRLLSLTATLALVTSVVPAQAALITSASMPAPKVVDFSQFGPYEFTGGPVQIGGLVGEDIVWTSTNQSSVIGQGFYGLGANGTWNARDYTGLGVDSGAMTYRFNDGPVSAVGGILNYTLNFDGPSDMFIEALAGDGSVLEVYNITALAPISTPGAFDGGAFRGISRGTADIAAFRVSNKFAVLDDLTFSRPSDVPEPALLGLISLGLLAVRRARRTH